MLIDLKWDRRLLSDPDEELCVSVSFAVVVEQRKMSITLLKATQLCSEGCKNGTVG